MRVHVFPTPRSLEGVDLSRGIAVVIDVLRATSTMVTALANGAREVVPVEEPEQARALAHQFSPGACLLGGERESVRIPGFDLGNSPLEYAPHTVRGKTVIMTTTNGTRALRRAAGARQVFAGSILNAGALAAHILPLAEDLFLVCAGRQGEFSLEDTLCAGVILNYLAKAGECNLLLTDQARAAMDLAKYHRGNLWAALAASEHGRSLAGLGFGADLEACARLDGIPVVPALCADRLRLVTRC